MKPFLYYNKLLISEPSLIMFVINPWFNQEMIGNLKNQNQTFYRSLARRVFFEFHSNDKDLSTIINKVKEPLMASYVSQKISGLIFLEDQSITETGKDRYKAYIYLNPRATNGKLTKNDFHILARSSNRHIIKEIDDFEHDNY